MLRLIKSFISKFRPAGEPARIQEPAMVQEPAKVQEVMQAPIQEVKPVAKKTVAKKTAAKKTTKKQ